MNVVPQHSVGEINACRANDIAVNNEQTTGEIIVRPGDVIRAGAVRFELIVVSNG